MPAKFAFAERNFRAERSFKMKTILVVEDEKHLRTLYSQELIAEGYQVVTAHDGKEALEDARKRYRLLEQAHPAKTDKPKSSRA